MRLYSSSPRNMRSVISVVLVVCGILGFSVFNADAADTVSSPVKSDVDSKPEAEKWEELLGKDATKLWRGYRKKGWPEGWKLEDGVLCREKKGDDLMTVNHYADFELRLEWKISSGGNSGIMYRVSDGDERPYFSGPEYQILDDSKHEDGKSTKTSAGALYGLYARRTGAPKPAGEWNKARILLQGNHVQHWLNGAKVVDCEIGSADWKERITNTKFEKWEQFAKNKTGHIVLQDHGDLVWYRNAMIRKLAPISADSSK